VPLRFERRYTITEKYDSKQDSIFQQADIFLQLQNDLQQLPNRRRLVFGWNF